jgi:hypothetical protein
MFSRAQCGGEVKLYTMSISNRNLFCSYQYLAQMAAPIKAWLLSEDVLQRATWALPRQFLYTQYNYFFENKKKRF